MSENGRWRSSVSSCNSSLRTKSTPCHSRSDPSISECVHRVDEAEIETQVSALRAKLLATMTGGPDVRSLKPSDRHGMAAAKKEELNKMAKALGTRSDYTEGDAFDREKQE